MLNFMICIEQSVREIFVIRGNFKSLQKWQKILVAICKWRVFGGYSSSFTEATEDKLGSHAQTTISNSSTIFFQPNFAGLLKLPQIINLSEKQFTGTALFAVLFSLRKELTFDFCIFATSSKKLQEKKSRVRKRSLFA